MESDDSISNNRGTYHTWSIEGVKWCKIMTPLSKEAIERAVAPSLITTIKWRPYPEQAPSDAVYHPCLTRSGRIVEYRRTFSRGAHGERCRIVADPPRFHGESSIERIVAFCLPEDITTVEAKDE